MADTATIAARVKALVIDHLGLNCEDLPESAQIQSLGADSIADVEIVTRLEEEFGIEIADEDLYRIRTIGDAIRQVTVSLMRIGNRSS